jgi:large subunit ribosomal protein L22
MATTAIAKLKYLHIAPRKTRSVADLIRGLSVNEAEAQLMLSTRRPGVPLLKLLRSAVANAKQTLQKEPAELYVKEIRVDVGPRAKRWTPRARGAMSLIEKKMSHITIVLGVAEHPQVSRFTFPPKPKKKDRTAHAHEHRHAAEKKASKAKKEGAEQETAGAEAKVKPEGGKRPGGKGKGFAGRMFQRKSV